MQNVTVKKDALGSILEANRELHKQAFAEAVQEFYAASKNIVTKAYETIPTGEITVSYNVQLRDFTFSLPAPKHFLREYDRAIHMLQMEVEDEIRLTAREFEQFVEDQWSWKDSFDSTKLTYRSFMS